MRCPYCYRGHLGVVATQETGEGSIDRRRKECPVCGKRITCYDKISPKSAAEVAAFHQAAR